MNRLHTKKTYAGLLGLAAAPALAQGQPVPDQRPNILCIVCEDSSPHLGCYGDTNARTPNIDRLAAGAVLYTGPVALARGELRIKLVKGEGGSLENIMPVLHDVKYGISIDLSDGTASTGSATADITSNRTSEIIRETILPAQTISKNTHFLTVREGVEPLLWIPQEDVVFAADRVKEIEITVYSNYATIKILGDIEGWDDDEDPVGGTV